MKPQECELNDYCIDIRKLLAAKKINLPGFVVSLLERLLHLKEINGFLCRGHEGIEFCEKTCEYLGVDATVSGLDELVLDPDKKYTFVSNHPLGGIDSVIILSKLGRKVPDGKIRIMVNDFLMGIKGLRPLFVPVNKTGAQSRSLSGQVEEMFNSDSTIMLFPAGLCSRKIDGKVQDLPWKKTFITKSIATGRPIIPIHFKGTNSKRFYNIANLRKKLGIKGTLEMALLPDEMMKSKGRHFEVVFGKPIEPEFFDSSRTPLEWAQYVREQVYNL